MDLIYAAKVISREVNKAGLVDIIGLTGTENIHGEEVKKLDEYANDRLFKAMDHGGHLCVMASEERDEVIHIPDKFPKGNYVLLFDPLDGSSNIDANVSIGTIFSIHRKKTDDENGTLEDCLQKGTDQVAAGYIIYGSSTMLVFTTGQGVNGYTLDPSVGEFILSHIDIKTPSKGKIYSANEGNSRFWDEGTKRYINHLKEKDSATAGHILCAISVLLSPIFTETCFTVVYSYTLPIIKTQIIRKRNYVYYMKLHRWHSS